jgi:protein-L-isoaspartate(D-aspartate) O-methyltransferase
MVDFIKARENMVDSQIHPMGIIWPGLLDAFMAVPREEFVPEILRNVAYTDEDISFGNERFMIDPITHARMIQALSPARHEVALDIGGLTGYSAAVLSHLVTTVIAVEETEALTSRANTLWQSLNIYNATSIKGPLTEGCRSCAAYNLIFIGGAVSEIPQELASQMVEGGRMVLVLKKPGQMMGQAMLIQSLGARGISSRVLFEAGAHYLPGFEPQPAFQF